MISWESLFDLNQQTVHDPLYIYIYIYIGKAIVTGRKIIIILNLLLKVCLIFNQ